jgi:hypothetical protein
LKWLLQESDGERPVNQGQMPCRIGINTIEKLSQLFWRFENECRYTIKFELREGEDTIAENVYELDLSSNHGKRGIPFQADR